MDHALSKFLEKAFIKWNCLSFFIQESELRTFTCITLSHIKVTPYCKPCTAVFAWLFSEFATEKPEHFCPFTDKLW